MVTKLIVNEETDKKTGKIYFSVSGKAGKHQFFRMGRYETIEEAQAYMGSLKGFAYSITKKLKKEKANAKI